MTRNMQIFTRYVPSSSCYIQQSSQQKSRDGLSCPLSVFLSWRCFAHIVVTGSADTHIIFSTNRQDVKYSAKDLNAPVHKVVAALNTRFVLFKILTCLKNIKFSRNNPSFDTGNGIYSRVKCCKAFKSFERNNISCLFLKFSLSVSGSITLFVH